MLRWLERIDIIRRPSARAGRPAAGAALGPGLVPAPRRRRRLRDRPKRPAAADRRDRLGPFHPVHGAGCRRRRTRLRDHLHRPGNRAPISTGLPVTLHRRLCSACGRAPRRRTRGRRHPVRSIPATSPCRAATSTVLLSEVLPQLRPGVLVHLHDIFLPDPYPAGWAGAATTSSSPSPACCRVAATRIRFASHYLATRHAGSGLATGVIGELPLSPGAFESSLWLREAARRRSLGVEERVRPVDAELGVRLPVVDRRLRVRCCSLARTPPAA